MKDDVIRFQEMSEDTLGVLQVARDMVQATHVRLHEVLKQQEEEIQRLQRRVAELESTVVELREARELDSQGV